MSREYPRRRDVRARCKELRDTLLANYNVFEGEFDRNFLTGVRDLMREGFSCEDAVLYQGEPLEDGEPEPTLDLRALLHDTPYDPFAL